MSYQAIILSVVCDPLRAVIHFRVGRELCQFNGNIINKCFLGVICAVNDSRCSGYSSEDNTVTHIVHTL